MTAANGSGTASAPGSRRTRSISGPVCLWPGLSIVSSSSRIRRLPDVDSSASPLRVHDRPGPARFGPSHRVPDHSRPGPPALSEPTDPPTVEFVRVVVVGGSRFAPARPLHHLPVTVRRPSPSCSPCASGAPPPGGPPPPLWVGFGCGAAAGPLCAGYSQRATGHGGGLGEPRRRLARLPHQVRDSAQVGRAANHAREARTRARTNAAVSSIRLCTPSVRP